MCLRVSETVCEPVGCGTGRVRVPGLPTETDLAGHVPLLPCPPWGGGRLRARWAGEAQPDLQGGPWGPCQEVEASPLASPTPAGVGR